MAEAEAPRSILYVCTHNIVRSPMAAALTQLQFGPLMRVESAGVRPGGQVSALAAAVMDEAGCDISGHRPRGLDAFEENEEGPFDLIVTLSPEAHHRALDLTPALGLAVEYWPTFDPTLAEGSREQALMEFRAVRDALAKRILARFPRPSMG